MQWRSRNIAQEIEQAKISCERILIEHKGHLIDFTMMHTLIRPMMRGKA